MSFSWWQPAIPAALAARQAESARESAREEVRDRARLLRSLGRSRDQAVARCRANLSWEHSEHPGQGVLAEVEELVDTIYGR